MIQWHPLFAKLLRPVLEGYYEIEINVPVGDVPRAADVVLLRRTRQGALPFQGVWSFLTAWNVLEYKAPSVSARLGDIDALVELGLGIHRRLNEDRDKSRRGRLGRNEVSFWYLVNRVGARFIAGAATLFGDLESVAVGMWRGDVLGRRVYFVSSRDLTLDMESLPFHVLAKEPPAKEAALTHFLSDQPRLWRDYTQVLVNLHPELLEEISMARLKEPTFNPQPFIKLFGKDLVVRKIIDEVGAKEMLDELLARLTPSQRRELRRRLRNESAAD
jgi:hypothetical protein